MIQIFTTTIKFSIIFFEQTRIHYREFCDIGKCWKEKKKSSEWKKVIGDGCWEKFIRRLFANDANKCQEEGSATFKGIKCNVPVQKFGAFCVRFSHESIVCEYLWDTYFIRIRKNKWLSWIQKDKIWERMGLKV